MHPSSFYNARDTLETTADARLPPRQHIRVVRQRRRIATFEHTRDGIEIVPPGATDVTLLTAPWTRDPLTAFGYVRTLPLDVGSTVTIPVNVMGRNLLLDVRAVGLERITYGGRTIEALRLEPAIRQQVQRRRPSHDCDMEHSGRPERSLTHRRPRGLRLVPAQFAERARQHLVTFVPQVPTRHRTGAS